MRKFLLILLAIICASPPSFAAIGNVTQSNPANAALNVQDTSQCSSTSPSGSYLIQQLPLNAATAIIALNGTFSGTVTVYASANNGTTWNSLGTVTNTTPLSVTVAGYLHLCADVTTYSSGIIGTTISSSLGISGSFSGSGGAAALAGNQNALYVSPTCPTPYVSGNCFPTAANTKILLTCNSVINTKTINCAGASFVSADIGKSEFGVTGGCNGAVPQALAVPEGTITAVNSSTQIVVSNQATSSQSGMCYAYGTPDDTTLAAVDTAAQAYPTCPVVYLPAAYLWWDSPHFSHQPTSCLNLIQVVDASPMGNGFQIAGAGMGQTLNVITPNFNTTNTGQCSAGHSNIDCIGGMANSWFHGMGFTGLGNNRSSVTSTKNFFSCVEYMRISNLTFDGFGFNDGTFGIAGIDVTPTTGPCEMDYVINTGFGAQGVSINGQLESTYLSVCCTRNNPIDVTTSGVWNINGQTFVGGTPSSIANMILIDNAGTVRGGPIGTFPNGSTLQYQAFKNESTGVASLQNSVFATSSTSSASNIGFWNNGGKAWLLNTVNFATGGNCISNSGTFVDQGNNTCTAGTVANSGTWLGDDSSYSSPFVAGNAVPSANFGTGAAVSAPTGNSKNFTFTLTNGSAAVGASPTIAVTFPTAFLVAPARCSLWQTGGTQAITALTEFLASSSVTATGVTFTYNGTPTINLTETYQGSCGN